MVPLTDRVGLQAEERARLQTAVSGLVTLQEVIRWGLSLPGQPTIVDVIVQDEYTHDAILPWREECHLAFDTT